jgi:hypothetical protein
VLGHHARPGTEHPVEGGQGRARPLGIRGVDEGQVERRSREPGEGVGDPATDDGDPGREAAARRVPGDDLGRARGGVDADRLFASAREGLEGQRPGPAYRSRTGRAR